MAVVKVNWKINQLGWEGWKSLLAVIGGSQVFKNDKDNIDVIDGKVGD